MNCESELMNAMDVVNVTSGPNMHARTAIIDWNKLESCTHAWQNVSSG